jgi:CRP-like cAMP-binding protein
MKKVVFNKGEVVFREGDMGTCFYQIEEGTAGVYVSYGNIDQRKLTEMKPGQFFGEMAVIEAWPRSTTIVAESDLHVIEIGEDELNAYFTEQPDKILALMKQLGGRIRDLTDEYDEVRAFIEEEKLPEGVKKEGFLAKLRKYLELNALSNKNGGATQEDILMMKDFGKLKKEDTDVLEFKRGEIIFREGDTGNYMYAIYGGSVGIYINYGTASQTKLTQLYSDAFFGEMGLIGEEKRSATAVVEEDGTILECIRAENLEELFKSNAVKIDMILCHLSHRLRRLTIDYVAACREAIENA